MGVQDNFFELGGNSLLVIRLLSRIRAVTGRSLPVAALFQNATVEHLAGLLREEAGPWSPLVELNRGGEKRPFFCVHPVGGTVLGYVELCRALAPDQPFYGLQSRGLEGDLEPCDSVQEMAALYLEALRTVQPRGPYLLGGWSMGGSIALEMARQLQQRGEQVELLALIDSYDLAPAVARLPPEQRETSGLGALFYKELALEEATLQRVLEKNLRAAWAYSPPPYEGRITVFEASESSLREQGGARFSASEVEAHTLEGDHFSLLRGARVVELAARLGTCLERAHAAHLARLETRRAAS
ncbi:alpha/beta fold hydrolase [Archangium gephyra]|uniref:thioesterase domain-containing protein n=1 Tax=Archangium gephyra TaxID=48 RepID=UPI003B81A034